MRCIFGPWRILGKSGTFVQGIFRNLKSCSLNGSALEKRKGFLRCGLPHSFSCIRSQSTVNTFLVSWWPRHSGIATQNVTNVSLWSVRQSTVLVQTEPVPRDFHNILRRFPWSFSFLIIHFFPLRLVNFLGFNPAFFWHCFHKWFEFVN